MSRYAALGATGVSAWTDGVSVSGLASCESLTHSQDQLFEATHGPHHDREAGQLVRVVPPEHVDAVDNDAIQISLELQYGTGLVMPQVRIAQCRAQDVERRGEVDGGYRLALLGSEHRRGAEYHILGKKIVKQARVPRLEDTVPRMHRDRLAGHGSHYSLS